MKSIQQKSTMVDLMIWVAIFGIQAVIAIHYLQSILRCAADGLVPVTEEAVPISKF